MPVQKSDGTTLSFNSHCMMSRIWYSDSYPLSFRQTGLVKPSSEALERVMSPTAVKYVHSMADPGPECSSARRPLPTRTSRPAVMESTSSASFDEFCVDHRRFHINFGN